MLKGCFLAKGLGLWPRSPARSAASERVIEYAIDEARSLNHDYVGTEHLLMGLLREENGIAARVLLGLGLSSTKLREEVLRVLHHSDARAAAELHAPTDATHWHNSDRELFLGLYRAAVSFYKPTN